jgi:hypothetical protein
MRKSILIAAALMLPALALSGKPEIRGIPVIYRGQPAVDGLVAPGEYAASFTDAKTGITVHWQADSTNLHCALQSPGKGWLAIGFGSEGMNGSAMILAYQDRQGQWLAEEHAGRAFFKHARAEAPKLVAAKAGVAGEHTVLEFRLPLFLANGETIGPSQPLPFILAMHKDNPRLSKHSKKSAGRLVLTLSR